MFGLLVLMTTLVLPAASARDVSLDVSAVCSHAPEKDLLKPLGQSVLDAATHDLTHLRETCANNDPIVIGGIDPHTP